MRTLVGPVVTVALLAAATLAAALALAPHTALAQNPTLAQNKVRTETIQVPPLDEDAEAPADEAMPAEEPAPAAPDAGTQAGDEPDAAATEEAPLPEVQYDLSRLPEPVARMRERIIEAARTGDIEKMRAVVEMNELPPIFSFGAETDPIPFWQSVSGDPEGREILAIMIEILEAGFVHLDPGSPQDVFVWPYFYAIPLDRLTPQQEVELYKLITPHDRKGMEEFGAYIFYRLGIGPDGTWHFFVAGD